MNKSKARILSLLTAILMLVSAVPALAEVPANPLKKLLEDSNLRFDVSMQLSPQLAGIFGFLNPEPMDEATMSAISTVVSAINKLKTSILVSKDAVSGVIGTDVAPIIDFQAVNNTQTKENGLTSNMMPGLVLSADPKLIESIMGKVNLPEIEPEKMAKMVQPYLDAVTAHMNEYLKTLPREEGTFVIEGYGTFAKRFQATLSSHMIAELMLKLAAIYKNDTAAQQFIKSMAAASQTAMPQGTGTGTLPSTEKLPDISAEMEKAANDIKTKPDLPLITAWVYESAGALYIDGESAKEVDMPFKLQILNQEKPGQALMKIKMIGKGTSYSEPPVATEKVPVDWTAVEEAILGGSDFTSILMNLEVKTSETAQVKDSNVNIAVNAQGMNFGLNLAVGNNLETKAQNAVIKISLFSPEPMMTLNLSVTPTDKAPDGLKLESAKPLVLKEAGLNEQENQLLQTTLQEALPALIQRLLQALPEEAGAITQLMESMNPQPSEIPPIGEPTVELLPAPSPVNP
jgi:hypothetical protein